jgi:hypothetical protein
MVHVKPKQAVGVLTSHTPFGMGDGCYLDPWFEVVCNNDSLSPPKPVLNKLDFARKLNFSNLTNSYTKDKSIK